MVNGRRAVAQDGVLPTGKDGGREAAEWPWVRGSDRVDTVVQPKQPMPFQPYADLARGDAGGQKLAAGDHTMLARRQVGDDFVDRHR